MRRAIALTGIVIVVVLIVLGVHSCEVSQRNSSLKDYSNSVATVVAKSNQTGKTLFNQLSGAIAEALPDECLRAIGRPCVDNHPVIDKALHGIEAALDDAALIPHDHVQTHGLLRLRHTDQTWRRSVPPAIAGG